MIRSILLEQKPEGEGWIKIAPNTDVSKIDRTKYEVSPDNKWYRETKPNNNNNTTSGTPDNNGVDMTKWEKIAKDKFEELKKKYK